MRIVQDLKKELEFLKKSIATESGQWIIKGFIDIYKNIYPLTIDTKVLSKVIEIILLPNIFDIANRYNYEIELPPHQNYYPDITFKDKNNGDLYAIDLKTTYRKNNNKINGMTLGAYSGYFRNRSSTKNIKHPYSKYKGHFILGVIYSRADVMQVASKNEFREYDLGNFSDIESEINDFQFFFVEKWKIAIDRPGSGNTKNIGSISHIDDLLMGTGPFTKIKNGKNTFDDYWMHYETLNMAHANGKERPLFKNLLEYNQWKKSSNE